MPGHVLEFLATKLKTPPLYVLGNHGNAYLYDAETDKTQLPGGCINIHGRVVEVKGLLIAGIEGSARYRPGPHQYTEREMAIITARFGPRFVWNELRKGRAVDIVLTHAPPKGPHEGQDYPHRGIPAFNKLIERWKPRLFIHGHVHLNGINAPREYRTETGTRVINAYEYTLIDFA
jgi:Icc-related predicted phosphoesterase